MLREKKVFFNEIEVGEEFNGDFFKVFFSNKNLPFKKIQTLYPDFKFQFLHQVHEIGVKKITKVSEPFPICDSIWTQSKLIALTIHTSDCVPLILINKRTKAINIAHIGWKG